VNHPLGEAIETFVRRENAERFVDEVRGDDRSTRATCGSRSETRGGGPYYGVGSTAMCAVKVAPRHVAALGAILTISSRRHPRLSRYSITASAGDHAFRTPTARLPE
jgi:hypothetical protein